MTCRVLTCANAVSDCRQLNLWLTHGIRL
jgi:hypothetical protein